MVYGHGRFWRASRNDRPADSAKPLKRPARSQWRGLDPECRIALIEHNLAIASNAG